MSVMEGTKNYAQCGLFQAGARCFSQLTMKYASVNQIKISHNVMSFDWFFSTWLDTSTAKTFIHWHLWKPMLASERKKWERRKMGSIWLPWRDQAQSGWTCPSFVSSLLLASALSSALCPTWKCRQPESQDLPIDYTMHLQIFMLKLKENVPKNCKGCRHLYIEWKKEMKKRGKK